MKRIGKVLLGVVMMAGLAGTSEAATSLIGTWSGTGSCASSGGYGPTVVTMKVLSQNTAGLFRGTYTVKGITVNEPMTGYISGVQVHVSGYTVADGLTSLWEVKYAATAPPTMKGYGRGTDGTICSVSLKKQ